MTIYYRAQPLSEGRNRVIESTTLSPEGRFHPSLVTEWLASQEPDLRRNDIVDDSGMLIDRPSEAVNLPPAAQVKKTIVLPKIEPAPAPQTEFSIPSVLQFFSPPERVAIRASSDPLVIDLMDMLNRIERTNGVIDITTGTWRDAVNYLTIASDEVAEVTAEGTQPTILTPARATAVKAGETYTG